MLKQADVCIHCGERHPARNFGLRHGEGGQCPKVIMGRFPLLSRPFEEESELDKPLAGSASQRIRDYETPVLPGSLPSRSGPGERARTMGLPWLPPPDLGSVI
jgi:hypothetical protein